VLLPKRLHRVPQAGIVCGQHRRPGDGDLNLSGISPTLRSLTITAAPRASQSTGRGAAFFYAQSGRVHMRKPVRKAISVRLGLDEDALVLLKLLAPSTKRFGSAVSELVRQEQVRREARGLLLKELVLEKARV